MGVLFSVVKLTANKKSMELLVGGIPKSPEDLKGWFKFWDFVNEIDEDEEIKVEAQGYIYGEEETFDATPEEVAYIMQRRKARADFIERRCQKAENAEFTFTKSEEQQFGLEMS